MKLASCKSALKPPVVYSTDRSKAVVPGLVLLLFALWFILRGDLFEFCLVLFCSCVSSPLSIGIASLGKERNNLSLLVRLFDFRLFGFVCFLFLLMSRKGWLIWAHVGCKSFRVLKTPFPVTRFIYIALATSVNTEQPAYHNSDG